MKQSKREILEWCYKQFQKIRDCHMDCDCTQEEHDMFHLADEAIQKISLILAKHINQKEGE